MADTDKIYAAVRKGLIPGPTNHCPLCGKDYELSNIVPHHWRGYDYPLDVWWICCHCNLRLSHRHDGSLTLEEARQVVKLDRRAREAFVGRNQAPDAVTASKTQPNGVCPICKRTFVRRSGLSSHINSAHGITLAKYESQTAPELAGWQPAQTQERTQ